MKIEKKLIKELVDYLKEFGLSELEYQDGQTKIKVSKTIKGVEKSTNSAVVSQNKAARDDKKIEFALILSTKIVFIVLTYFTIHLKMLKKGKRS